MPDQLAFDLPLRTAMGRDAFFVAPPNALALAEIDRWRTWPTAKLALVGPEGAGKSHLAAVWAADAGADYVSIGGMVTANQADPCLIVEEAEAVAGDAEAERWLLHLHNHTLEQGGRLLLTTRTPPARWPVGLPDLASRLTATPVARLEPPDDTLLAALLVKLFDDRQLRVSPDLIRWCLPRMERTFAAAQALVAALDARALATKSPVGRKLAAEVLDALPPNGQ